MIFFLTFATTNILCYGEKRFYDESHHAFRGQCKERRRSLWCRHCEERYDLSGCEIYTSCEPCPMCLGAIYWAHLDKIYYANDRKDAARIGFDDDFIYQELEQKPQYRKKPSEIFMQAEASKAFDMWMQKDDKTEY